MTRDRNDDFYIGYAGSAPPRVARTVRRAVIFTGLVAAALAVTLALVQRPFDPGIFEFGLERKFTGIVRTRPFPLLEVARPAGTSSSEASGSSHYALVSLGKHGALDEVRPFEGRTVELTGTLIFQGTSTMIELVRDSIRPAAEETQRTPPSPEPVDLGMHTLQGEIVDSKCYLGVMKPGRRKTHRACATLCILGGVPPVFHVETSSGEFQHFYLTDESGEPVNSRVLEFVAEPIEISGRMVMQGNVVLLAADPAGYRRLAGVERGE